MLLRPPPLQQDAQSHDSCQGSVQSGKKNLKKQNSLSLGKKKQNQSQFTQIRQMQIPVQNTSIVSKGTNKSKKKQSSLSKQYVNYHQSYGQIPSPQKYYEGDEKSVGSYVSKGSNKRNNIKQSSLGNKNKPNINFTYINNKQQPSIKNKNFQLNQPKQYKQMKQIYQSPQKAEQFNQRNNTDRVAWESDEDTQPVYQIKQQKNQPVQLVRGNIYNPPNNKFSNIPLQKTVTSSNINPNIKTQFIPYNNQINTNPKNNQNKDSNNMNPSQQSFSNYHMSEVSNRHKSKLGELLRQSRQKKLQEQSRQSIKIPVQSSRINTKSRQKSKPLEKKTIPNEEKFEIEMSHDDLNLSQSHHHNQIKNSRKQQVQKQSLCFNFQPEKKKGLTLTSSKSQKFNNISGNLVSIVPKKKDTSNKSEKQLYNQLKDNQQYIRNNGIRELSLRQELSKNIPIQEKSISFQMEIFNKQRKNFLDFEQEHLEQQNNTVKIDKNITEQKPWHQIVRINQQKVQIKDQIIKPQIKQQHILENIDKKVEIKNYINQDKKLLINQVNKIQEEFKIKQRDKTAQNYEYQFKKNINNQMNRKNQQTFKIDKKQIQQNQAKHFRKQITPKTRHKEPQVIKQKEDLRSFNQQNEQFTHSRHSSQGSIGKKSNSKKKKESTIKFAKPHNIELNPIVQKQLKPQYYESNKNQNETVQQNQLLLDSKIKSQKIFTYERQKKEKIRKTKINEEQIQQNQAKHFRKQITPKTRHKEPQVIKQKEDLRSFNQQNEQFTHSRHSSQGSIGKKSNSKKKKESTIKFAKPHNIEPIINSPRGEQSYYEEENNIKLQQKQNQNEQFLLEMNSKINEKRKQPQVLCFSDDEEIILNDHKKFNTDSNFYDSSQKVFKVPSSKPPLSRKSNYSSSKSKGKIKQNTLPITAMGNKQRKIGVPEKLRKMTLAQKAKLKNYDGDTNSQCSFDSRGSMGSVASKNSRKSSKKKQGTLNINWNMGNTPPSMHHQISDQPERKSYEESILHVDSEYQTKNFRNNYGNNKNNNNHNHNKNNDYGHQKPRTIVSKDCYFIDEYGKLVRKDMVISGNNVYGRNTKQSQKRELHNKLVKKLSRSRSKQYNRQRSNQKSKNYSRNESYFTDEIQSQLQPNYQKNYQMSTNNMYSNHQQHNTLRQFMKPLETPVPQHKQYMGRNRQQKQLKHQKLQSQYYQNNQYDYQINQDNSKYKNSNKNNLNNAKNFHNTKNNNHNKINTNNSILSKESDSQKKSLHRTQNSRKRKH